MHSIRNEIEFYSNSICGQYFFDRVLYLYPHARNMICAIGFHATRSYDKIFHWLYLH